MKQPMLILVMIGAFVAATPAHAHHSFAATYFEDKVQKVEGNLVQFLYRNPHSFVHLPQIFPILPPHRANHARRGPRFAVVAPCQPGSPARQPRWGGRPGASPPSVRRRTSATDCWRRSRCRPGSMDRCHRALGDGLGCPRCSARSGRPAHDSPEPQGRGADRSHRLLGLGGHGRLALSDGHASER